MYSIKQNLIPPLKGLLQIKNFAKISPAKLGKRQFFSRNDTLCLSFRAKFRELSEKSYRFLYCAIAPGEGESHDSQATLNTNIK